MMGADDNESSYHSRSRLVKTKAALAELDVIRLTRIRLFGENFRARLDATVAFVSSDCPSSKEQYESHREAGNQSLGPGIHADLVIRSATKNKHMTSGNMQMIKVQIYLLQAGRSFIKVYAWKMRSAITTVLVRKEPTTKQDVNLRKSKRHFTIFWTRQQSSRLQIKDFNLSAITCTEPVETLPEHSSQENIVSDLDILANRASKSWKDRPISAQQNNLLPPHVKE